MILSLLLIHLLQYLYRKGSITALQASWILIILSGILFVSVVLLLIFAFRKKKKLYFLIAGFLVLYSGLVISKWVPYFDGNEKTITPELVSQRALSYEAFDTGIPIYRNGMPYDRYALPYLTEEEQSWVNEKAVDLEQYSYILIGKSEIQSLRYTVWDSYDYAPAPFYDLTITPQWEVSDSPGTFAYLYRLPPIRIAPFY